MSVGDYASLVKAVSTRWAHCVVKVYVVFTSELVTCQVYIRFMARKCIAERKATLV